MPVPYDLPHGTSVSKDAGSPPRSKRGRRSTSGASSGAARQAAILRLEGGKRGTADRSYRTRGLCPSLRPGGRMVLRHSLIKVKKSATVTSRKGNHETFAWPRPSVPTSAVHRDTHCSVDSLGVRSASLESFGCLSSAMARDADSLGTGKGIGPAVGPSAVILCRPVAPISTPPHYVGAGQPSSDSAPAERLQSRGRRQIQPSRNSFHQRETADLGYLAAMGGILGSRRAVGRPRC